MTAGDLSRLHYGADGLIPAIAQDAATQAVLMVAYMNEEALHATLESGYATYYSRSRQALWRKGETSGNTQKVQAIYYDCDGDALLLKVEQTGPACHTGNYSCFANTLAQTQGQTPGFELLAEEYAVITDRRQRPVEGSYTNYLFEKGIDKMLKKVGEEAAEVIIAAKNPDVAELRYEIADLLFHTMVVMAQRGLTWQDILAEVKERRK